MGGLGPPQEILSSYPSVDVAPLLTTKASPVLPLPSCSPRRSATPTGHRSCIYASPAVGHQRPLHRVASRRSLRFLEIERRTISSLDPGGVLTKPA
ncbi:hypothetical protein ZWY2020_025155 [Hordeum vulgare]|nr:hypothetical protein ZWY2020_025155 [Hordeum vulgare]